MKRTNIKEGFGGEVPFTKFIADNLETSRRLLTSLDLSYEDGYKITPEEHTVHSKRVDLVVRDSDNDIVLVIESQDASGWLDAIHASKITYYMYDKKCDDGVLICEDADEHIKGYVKWVNENTPLRVTLVSVIMFETKDKPHCEFIPIIRPSNIEDKKVVRRSNSSSTGETDQNKAAWVQELADSNPDLFTNIASRYASRNNVGGTGINVGIHPYSSGTEFFVELWHGGKYDTDTFHKSFTDVCSKNGLEAKFQQRRGYAKVTSKEGGLNAFKLFVSALENKEITV